MRNRRVVIAAAAALGLIAVAARHPTADFRLLTHDARDRAPVRIQAAIDLGLVGVSVLYTFTRQLR